MPIVVANFFDSVTPEQAAIGVAVIVAVLAFVWGVIRQIAGMVALAAGCVVGWIVFTQGPDFYWMKELTARYHLGVSVISGGAIFLLLRVLTNWFFSFGSVFNFFSKIFGKSGGKGIVGAIVSLVPTSFLVLVSGLVLRLGGAVDGLDATNLAIHQTEGTDRPEATLLNRASRWIENSWFNELIDKVDPIAAPEIEKLGRMLLLTQDAQAWQMIRTDPTAMAVLNHPDVLAFARDQHARDLLTSKNRAVFFSDPRLRELSENPEIRPLLAEVSIDALIGNTLYGSVEGAPDDQSPVRRAYQNPYR